MNTRNFVLTIGILYLLVGTLGSFPRWFPRHTPVHPV